LDSSGFRRKNATLFLVVVTAEDDPALRSEFACMPSYSIGYEVTFATKLQ